MVNRGFTLIELLTVLAIIAILLGLLLPLGNYVLNQSRINRARALVSAVAAAIASHPQQTWVVEVADAAAPTGIRRVSYPHLWDLNQESPVSRPGDGYIDGTPGPALSATTDGPFWLPLIDAGYSGFVDLAMPELRPRQVNAIGQPVDAWRQPLRIAFSANAGTEGFRVWSIGRDGIDAEGVADDISSARVR